MYNPQKVVGRWGEDTVMPAFNLERADRNMLGNVPDLISKYSPKFYVEVKTSAYNNGGVINREQLFRFDEEVNTRRFYVFVNHSITKNMQRNYSSAKKLMEALDVRSMYWFPFSIVKAHFINSKATTTEKHDDYVQLDESQAEDIFKGKRAMWQHLGLDKQNYKKLKLNEKVKLITRDGNLEEQISTSFRPEFL